MVGDLNHLSAMLGHQGSSSSFPSPWTKVTKEHLTNHSGAHNLKNCEIELRTADELQNNYVENVAKNPDELRKGGKKCGSVIGETLFPLTLGIFTQVVPPFLHIFMGLFKYLEEQFMKEIEAIDKVTVDPKERESLIQSIDNENEKLTTCNNLSKEWIELKQISEKFASPTTPSVDCKSLVCVGKSCNYIACDSDYCKKKDLRMHSECEG